MTERTAGIILADIVKRYEDHRRDAGAFPSGDHRTARAEQFLWHSIQNAKAWLKSRDGECAGDATVGQCVPTKEEPR